MLAPLTLLAIVAAPPSQAQGEPSHPGLGFLLDAGYDPGGNSGVVFGQRTTQSIDAGRGPEVSVGAHYLAATIPIDVAASVGFKSDVPANPVFGLYRMVWKLTGTLQLPSHFWVDAGPVWHTAIHEQVFAWNVPFQSAMGGTVGAGWRVFGLSYTHIKYSATGGYSGEVDASSLGVTFTWKF
jgi:hypothetical protein